MFRFKKNIFFLFFILILGACQHQQGVENPTLTFHARNDLNVCPKSTVGNGMSICVYQLTKVDTIKKLLNDNYHAGIEFLTDCDKYSFENASDHSVIETYLFPLDPGQTNTIQIKSDPTTKYIVIVGDFCHIRRGKCVKIFKRPFTDMSFVIGKSEIIINELRY